MAGAAGAVGFILYNNAPGTFTGSLGGFPRPEGDFILSVTLSGTNGLALVERVNGGESVIATITVDSVTTQSPTYNIFAQTKGGDQKNILQLGGHLDSVKPGPGINDDGSGSVALLELAVQLTKFRVKNAVKFSWWTGEEEGLVGSSYHVTNLPADKRALVRAYLNFDMIASPNYVLSIFDGDGSAFNLTGPPGSSQIEKLFEDYFANIERVPSVPTAYSGRSDYYAFIENGIPAGGLFTGAEQLKTEAQQQLFGGVAGVAYDINYHLVGDTLANCNGTAWAINTRAIAHAIAIYSNSWDTIPERTSSATQGPKARALNDRKPAPGRTLSARASLGKSLRRGATIVDEREVAILGKTQACGAAALY